jgi:SAM-dependent methyltransferase
MEVDPRWYERFFEDDWLRVALATPEEAADKAVGFLDHHLGVDRGARILDLACGHGRHTIRLAKLGYRVTGVDLSATSLELARARAAEAGVDVDFRQGDMREIDFDAEFDAVVNLFTSFGYFDDEADDRRVLERVARSLKPGGVFVIDVISLLAIARSFQPRHWDELRRRPRARAGMAELGRRRIRPLRPRSPDRQGAQNLFRRLTVCSHPTWRLARRDVPSSGTPPSHHRPRRHA